MVHHANRVRPQPQRDQGRRPPGLERLDGLAHDRAVVRDLEAPDRVSVKPHASPVLHAINFLLGRLDPAYLPRLREFGGLQSYPSRTKDPDPVDYSTGSRSASGPPRRSGARWPTATSPGTSTCRVGGRQIALLGDAELDEGAVWEAIVDPMVRAPGRGAVGRRPQPPVARPRGARHRRRAAAAMFRRPAGTSRRSSTAGGCARCSGAPAARRCAPASTPWATRSTSACCAPTPASCASGCPAATRRSRALIADLDDARSCWPRCATSAATTSARCSRPTARPTRSPTGRRSCSPTRSRAGGCRSRATRATTPRC